MQYHQKCKNKQERSDVICLFNNFESVKIILENVKNVYKKKKFCFLKKYSKNRTNLVTELLHYSLLLITSKNPLSKIAENSEE